MRLRTVGVLMTLLGGVAFTTASGSRSEAAQPSPRVDPKADALLKQMTAFLSGLQSFQVRSFTVDQEALLSGEKIQRTSTSEVTVQRPNRLRSTPVGAGQGLALFYDGNNLTLTCAANGAYTTVPAPPTLDAAIDTMRKELKIDAPGADLLYSKPYPILMEQVTAGRVIGPESIEGIPVTHLAFEGDEVDWQIWIQDGATPFPMRFVITTKTVKGHPEFSAQFSNWQTKANVGSATFVFQPPPGAMPAKSVAATCGAQK